MNVYYSISGWWFPTPAPSGPEHVPASFWRSSRRAFTAATPRVKRTFCSIDTRDGPYLPRYRQVLQGDRDVSDTTINEQYTTYSPSKDYISMARLHVMINLSLSSIKYLRCTDLSNYAIETLLFCSLSWGLGLYCSKTSFKNQENSIKKTMVLVLMREPSSWCSYIPLLGNYCTMIKNSSSILRFMTFPV